MNGISREVRSIALSLMEGLDCPRSLTVAILIKSEDWKQLAELTVSVDHYKDSESLFCAMAATAFLKKYVDMPTGEDLEEKAVQAFYESEKRCYLTNQRLLPFMSGTYEPGDEPILEFIQEVREVIVEMIGHKPPDVNKPVSKTREFYRGPKKTNAYCYNEQLVHASDQVSWDVELGRFGPGATMSDKSLFTTVADKLSSRPTMTTDFWPFLFPWSGTEWAKCVTEAGMTPQVIRGNAFFTVPKSAVQLRGCGKEPSLNVFYQLGLGQLMKKLMRRWGLDLIEGQDRHRQVACEASNGSLELATLDLSSASDTVSSALVRLLLPPAWFEVLDALRSKYTLVKERWVLLEKFSSMGNGFTFELETLIFAAICKVACRHDVHPGVDLFVYGDDIIVPIKYVSAVKAALSYFGFKLNDQKSFWQGSFRESCGGDFYNGVGVRPFYLKEEPNEPQQYIALANGLRRMAFGPLGVVRRWELIRRAWFITLDSIPSGIRQCRGPEALGDVVIHDFAEYWQTRSVRKFPWVRFFKAYRPAFFKEVRWDGFSYSVQMAAATYGVSRYRFKYKRKVAVWDQKSRRFTYELAEPGLIPRDGVTGYKVGLVPWS